jgi:hypothetical protein
MDGQSMIEIKITLQDDGQVLVNGPLQDKIPCYGLLEMAKEIIKDYKADNLIKIPDIKIRKQ